MQCTVAQLFRISVLSVFRLCCVFVIEAIILPGIPKFLIVHITVRNVRVSSFVSRLASLCWRTTAILPEMKMRCPLALPTLMADQPPLGGPPLIRYSLRGG